MGEANASDDPEITEWPDALPELADAVRAGRLLVLTGAGVSHESDIPLARGVVDMLRQEDRIGSDVLDYQEAMSRAFDSDAARGEFIRRMCYKKFAGPGNQAIALLAQRHAVGPLLTTNFDHLLEQACVALGSRAVTVSTVGSPSSPSGGAGAVQVLKLHGDAKFDMTAHSNEEMSEHHAWLTRWSQFEIDPGSVLLAVGHSGNDGPVRALVQDLVESGQVARVYWIVLGSPSDRLSSFAHSLGVDGDGRLLRIVKADDGASALVGLYERVSGDTFERRQELLPGFQVVTGLYHGAGEIDPYSLRGRGRQSVVDAVRRADERGTRLVHVRASSAAEAVFQSVVDASLQFGSGPRFVFSLDQAQQLPREVALSRSLSAWCARVLGRSLERSRLHLAIQGLPIADLWMIVNTVGLVPEAAWPCVELLELLARAAPEGVRIWIISEDEDDDGVRSAARFSTLRLNSPSLILPEESAGVLPYLRAPLSEEDFAQVLHCEGRGRRLEDLLRLGVAVSRGAAFVVDQTRWAQQEHHSQEHWMGRALEALRAVRANKNGFERISLDLDIERLSYFLAKKSASPAERSAHAANGLRELTDAAVSFAGPEASLWFLATLRDYVTGFGLDGAHGRMLHELVRRLEHVKYAGGRVWQGSPAGLSRGLLSLSPLYRLLDRIIDECLAEVGSGSPPDADAIKAAMRRMEARWPGSSYLLPGWMVPDREKPFDRGNFGEYVKRLDLAHQIAEDKTLAPVQADDVAEMWFTLGLSAERNDFIGEAFRLWREISLDLIEFGGIAAVIHQCRYAVAHYVCGYKAEASSLLFEAMSSAEYLGDEARVWRAMLPLWLGVEEDSSAALWIKSWIHEVGEDEAGDVAETLGRIVRERGELLEARLHEW